MFVGFHENHFPTFRMFNASFNDSTPFALQSLQTCPWCLAHLEKKGHTSWQISAQADRSHHVSCLKFEVVVFNGTLGEETQRFLLRFFFEI